MIVFGCDYGAAADLRKTDNAAVVHLACVGQLPPMFIDYVLSRNLADGVVLAGCAENGCHARLGLRWTQARLAGERDPQLRARVPKDRVRPVWLNRSQGDQLKADLSRFARTLSKAEDGDG